LTLRECRIETNKYIYDFVCENIPDAQKITYRFWVNLSKLEKEFKEEIDFIYRRY